jgi:hypothetical protein
LLRLPELEFFPFVHPPCELSAERVEAAYNPPFATRRLCGDVKEGALCEMAADYVQLTPL